MAIELGLLDGSDGFRLDGAAPFDQVGTSVSGAGDVNGDGFADVIVGARYADPNGSQSGATYVVFGSDQGFAAALSLADLDGTNGLRLVGAAAIDLSGFSVAGAGDVNGDGFDDIIVGAPVADPSGNASGASYVVFGRGGGFTATFNLSALDGTSGFRLDGAARYDQSGFSVAGAGDVNGDGLDDLIVGARYADPNGAYSGATYVVFGQASGFAPSLDLGALDGTKGFRLDGAVAAVRSGGEVASAGDLNGDGFDDLVVGVERAGPNGAYSGATYVVFGRASGFAPSLDLGALDGTNGFRLDGVAAFDRSGAGVSAAGDVNGDGVADLLIGASGAGVGRRGAGASFVVFGRAEGFAATLDLGDLDGTNGFRIDGARKFDSSGADLSGAGDVNGDGFDDLIIGASGQDQNGSNAGVSYVVFGGALGAAAVLDLRTLEAAGLGVEIRGAAALDLSGAGVAGAGDVNGDGVDDLVIGARGVDLGGSYAGASYVVFGRAELGFADIADGDQAANLLTGGNGPSLLRGLAGRDTLAGGDRADRLEGGAGGDMLRGNAKSDNLIGGLGADRLVGGGGADRLHYAGVAESASTRFDTSRGFDFDQDVFRFAIDRPTSVTEIEGGRLDAASFDADLGALLDASVFAAGAAALLTPDAGGFAGQAFLIVDGDGDAGYQAGQDYVIRLLNARNTGQFDLADVTG